MIVYRNSEVDERSPALEQLGTKFLARALSTRLTSAVAGLTAQQAADGYLAHFLSRSVVQLPVISGHTEHRESEGAEASLGTRDLRARPASLFVQAVHGAFAEHVPFSLSPEVAWYLIAHEVSVHIRQNAERYRGHFTTSITREDIIVRDDSLVYGSLRNRWDHTIRALYDTLQAHIPKATIDLMLPKLSTSSFESETALFVVILDMAANYYQFGVETLCGIPAIRVEGEAADWREIVSHAEQLQGEFDGLRPYFADLLPVLREVAGTVDGNEPDPDFWNSIYKFGGESGGPYISGWISTFFAHTLKLSGVRLRDKFDWRSNTAPLAAREIPVHLNKVPFVWNYLGSRINMVFIAGVMGVEYDGYLNPRLGFGVLEEARGRRIVD